MIAVVERRRRKEAAEDGDRSMMTMSGGAEERPKGKRTCLAVYVWIDWLFV
jgi:hypothetical protein